MEQTLPNNTTTLSNISTEKNDHLYVGKWTSEEEEYVSALIANFRAGNISDIPDGTTLRGYIAKMLGCRQKRVSKHYERSGYNGRQNYKDNEANLPTEEAQRMKNDLEDLRTAFLASRSQIVGKTGSYERCTGRISPLKNVPSNHHSPDGNCGQGTGGDRPNRNPPPTTSAATVSSPDTSALGAALQRRQFVPRANQQLGSILAAVPSVGHSQLSVPEVLGASACLTGTAALSSPTLLAFLIRQRQQRSQAAMLGLSLVQSQLLATVLSQADDASNDPPSFVRSASQGGAGYPSAA